MEKHLAGPKVTNLGLHLFLQGRLADQTKAQRSVEIKDPTSPPKCINRPCFYLGGAHLHTSLIDYKILHVPFFSRPLPQFCEVGHVLISHLQIKRLRSQKPSELPRHLARAEPRPAFMAPDFLYFKVNSPSLLD